MREPSCWILVPSTDFCFSCRNTKSSSDPVSCITSRNDPNVFSRRTNICSLGKLRSINDFIKNLLNLRILSFHRVWKFTVKRDDELLASAVEIVDKLNFWFVCCQEISYSSGFWLWEWSLSVVIVGLAFFFSSVSLSESEAVVSVKVDAGIGLAAEVRVDVHIRSLV